MPYQVEAKILREAAIKTILLVVSEPDLQYCQQIVQGVVM